ncbi:unnamed protein product [Meloidogyne enterolobii]|uniref:Uncharacterized protein n=1 Tax=Meloidogyne enterolobii TaxID=390850 RepID=A0ACB0XQH8_MELEN
MGLVEKKGGSDFGSGFKIFLVSGFGYRVEKRPCLGSRIGLFLFLENSVELSVLNNQKQKLFFLQNYFVGNFNPLTLFWFWIIPRLLIILIGFFLLLAGFSSMCNERNKFKNKGTDTSRLEKFLLKMGIFSLIYLFSISLNSLCDLHHLIVLSEWQPNTINCKTKGGAFSGNCIRPEQPEPKLYVFGQTMGMATGLAVGLCIFSPKTLTTMSSLSSWKNALICCWPLQTKKSAIINSSFKSISYF